MALCSYLKPATPITFTRLSNLVFYRRGVNGRFSPLRSLFCTWHLSLNLTSFSLRVLSYTVWNVVQHIYLVVLWSKIKFAKKVRYISYFRNLRKLFAKGIYVLYKREIGVSRQYALFVVWCASFFGTRGRDWRAHILTPNSNSCAGASAAYNILWGQSAILESFSDSIATSYQAGGIHTGNPRHPFHHMISTIFKTVTNSIANHPNISLL